MKALVHQWTDVGWILCDDVDDKCMLKLNFAIKDKKISTNYNITLDSVNASINYYVDETLDL